MVVMVKKSLRLAGRRRARRRIATGLQVVPGIKLPPVAEFLVSLAGGVDADYAPVI